MCIDLDLLTAIKHGCEDSYEELYRRYSDRIHRFAQSRVQDFELASDILQETFLTVWRGAASFAGNSTVSTWIYGIAVNKTREQRRKRGPDTIALDSVAATLRGPDFTHGTNERLTILGAVHSLPEEQQEVVLLAFYAELNYSDIAEIQSVPVGTVKSRMFLAKKALMQSLKTGVS